MTRPVFFLAPLASGVLGCSAIVEPDRTRLDTEPLCELDSECDDDLYCNGVEECVARHCHQTQRDLPCDDEIPCTIDYCDEGDHGCRNVPDDDSCLQDPVAQICDVARGGCVATGG